MEAALARASGFIRSQLALGLDLKRVPHLRFVYVGIAPRGTAPLSHEEPAWDDEPGEGGDS